MLTKVIIFALFAFIACSPDLAYGARPEGVAWHKDLKAARELARQTGKPMLLDFVADWCNPCKEMARSFWPKPQVVALSEKFVCVSINFDKRGPELSQYKVDRIPAVVFTDPWGNFMTAKFGFGNPTPDELTKLMQVVPPDFSPLAEWNAMLDRDKNNPVALAKIGAFYSKHGILDLSTSYLKKALKSKEMEANLEAYGELLIAVGINYLKQQEYGEARKMFEDYQKQVPGGKHADTALFGIFMSHLGRKKIDDAEKSLAQLRASHPNSPVTQQAAEQLERAKNQKR
jgi:thiol-disulfide isomerase/thioredoxin